MNVFDYFFSESKNQDKDFVHGVNEVISFKDIYTHSIKLAYHLKTTYGENNKIIIISHNSVFFIVSYLGILKSGNICVPLNPEIEQDNLNYIISITESKLSLVSSKVRNSLIVTDDIIKEVDLDKIIQKNSNWLEKEYENDFDDKRTAEIIFTSGSTGEPKGVMLSHLNLKSNTSSIIEYLKLSSNEIAGVLLPFFYCYGLSVLHTHLKVGGSVVLINNFIMLGSVIDNLVKFKCTSFAGVPSHFQILLRKSPAFCNTEFNHLRYVTQAGGKLHNTFIEEFVSSFPNVDFIVMYGQTEATARLSYLPTVHLKSKMGSIGKGIPGVTLKVLNSEDQPVAPGEIGELVAQGNNVMQGYFKNEKDTKEILKNGWLYTGDFAIVDEDGYIYLVARKKEIIKVGGNRVSPKEIEEVILTVPEVLDCTILGINDEMLGEAIKAIIVLAGDNNIIEVREKILKKCSEKLSHYKIPKFIEFAEKLDVSSTGKKVKKNYSEGIEKFTQT